MSHVKSRKELADTVDTPVALTPPRSDRPSLLVRLPQLPQVAKGTRIVKASANADLFDAEAAIAAARAETKKLKVEISTAIEQGRDEGYAAGRDEANRELAVEIHRVQQFQAQWMTDARETIVDLAVKIAGRLVGTFDVDETMRATIVAQTLKHASDAPYTLQVASDRLGIARQALRQIEEERPDVALPNLRLDARLPEGRAILVTRFGSIDLDVDAQLEAIRASLVGRAAGEEAAYTNS